MRAKANNLRRQGASYGDISKALKISKSTAHAYCKDAEYVEPESEYIETERSEPPSTAYHEEILIQYAVAKNELEYLKRDKASLEREVYELKTENHKLSNEKRELMLDLKVADREKEIAVQLAILHYKENHSSGLGALKDPQVLNTIGNLGEMFLKAVMSARSRHENPVKANEREKMSEIKERVLEFMAFQIKPLTDNEADKLGWLMKNITENKKIEELFIAWSAPQKQENAG